MIICRDCVAIGRDLTRYIVVFAAFAALLDTVGCVGGLAAIDERTERMVLEASNRVGEPANQPRLSMDERVEGESFVSDSPDLRHPDTSNPSAQELAYVERPSREIDISAAVAGSGDPLPTPPPSRTLNMASSVGQAFTSSVEFRVAEEEYLLVVLDLLVQLHAWSPQLVYDITPQFQAVSVGSSNSTALQLVNDFTVSQRLPWGGTVSAQIISQMSDQLSSAVGGSQPSDLQGIFALDIPLLRGAGLVAQEGLIQAQRNTVYAARAFEDFRRRFYLSLLEDYLGLVLQQQVLANTRDQINSLRAITHREDALVQAGRQVPFQADLAKSRLLFAMDRIAGLEEAYRLAVDQFKVRLGIDASESIGIEPEMLDLAPPLVETDRILSDALERRLDLQTQSDQVDDYRRRIDVARNGLLPGADVFAEVSLLKNPEFFNGIQLDNSFENVVAGININIPLDRTIEEIEVRRAQIRFEQARRAYTNSRDESVVEIRQAVRAIDRALLSLQLQERNIEIARNRQESINAAPDRASPRDRTDAVDSLGRAEDDRDRSHRTVQLAVLGYLLSTGQLRVAKDGMLVPPAGLSVKLLHGERLLSTPIMPPA